MSNSLKRSYSYDTIGDAIHSLKKPKALPKFFGYDHNDIKIAQSTINLDKTISCLQKCIQDVLDNNIINEHNHNILKLYYTCIDRCIFALYDISNGIVDECISSLVLGEIIYYNNPIVSNFSYISIGYIGDGNNKTNCDFCCTDIKKSIEFLKNHIRYTVLNGKIDYSHYDIVKSYYNYIKHIISVLESLACDLLDKESLFFSHDYSVPFTYKNLSDYCNKK